MNSFKPIILPEISTNSQVISDIILKYNFIAKYKLNIFNFKTFEYLQTSINLSEFDHKNVYHVFYIINNPITTSEILKSIYIDFPILKEKILSHPNWKLNEFE